MSGPELCNKCGGFHYRRDPCIVRKPKPDVATTLTPEVLQSVIGKEFSRPMVDLHPDRIRRGPGRPKTITDMAAYKAAKQREYRARSKASKPIQ